MVKSVALFLCLVGAVTITGREAAAVRALCPLPVRSQARAPHARCNSELQPAADTGVTIAVYALNGGFTSVWAAHLPARTGTFRMSASRWGRRAAAR